MAEKTDYYEPSLNDVQRVIDETLDTAADGVDPMFPIEDLGQCYFVDLSGGRDVEMHPWTFGIGRFFLDDEEGRIHWMHPEIRTSLNKITPELLLEAVTRNPSRESDKTPEELAQTFYEWCQENLAKLDARMRRSIPFHDAVSHIGRYPSPELAHAALDELCKQHELTLTLGRNIARRALRLDLCGYVSMDQPVARAALLARMIDTQHCLAPDVQKARQALARLYLAKVDDEPDIADIACVAIATAHGQFPENLPAEQYRTSGALALLTYQIEAGQLDPKMNETRPFAQLHSRIGQLLLGDHPSTPPISAHQTLLLIGSANARMRLIGQPPLTPEQCREAAEADNQIPF